MVVIPVMHFLVGDFLLANFLFVNFLFVNFLFVNFLFVYFLIVGLLSVKLLSANFYSVETLPADSHLPDAECETAGHGRAVFRPALIPVELAGCYGQLNR